MHQAPDQEMAEDQDQDQDDDMSSSSEDEMMEDPAYYARMIDDELKKCFGGNYERPS